MRTWSDHLFSFYLHLEPPAHLPTGIDWLYPQQNPEVMQVVKQFLDKYYNDTAPRSILLGINPGRFGAGVTGVNFSAPRQLKDYCGIETPFKDQTELSASFIYEMINAFGGPGSFYGRYFIGSACPLGFIKNGKNINYYDDPRLLEAVEPFMIHNLQRLLDAPVNRERGFSIGGEKNFKYLSKLNSRYQWFKELVPLPHPRFIMQYRRKQVPQFIQLYLQLITK